MNPQIGKRRQRIHIDVATHRSAEIATMNSSCMKKTAPVRSPPSYNLHGLRYVAVNQNFMHVARCSEFPSLQRRGGRAIKKMMPKATKVGADGVVSPRNISSQMTTPSAPLRWLRSIFMMAQPLRPVPGGKSDSLYHRLEHLHGQMDHLVRW